MGRGIRGTSASKGIHTCPKNSFSRQNKQLAYTTKYNVITAMLWKYTRLQVKHSNRRQGMKCGSSQSLQWYSLLSVYNISSISFEDTLSTVHPSYTHPQTLLWFIHTATLTSHFKLYRPNHWSCISCFLTHYFIIDPTQYDQININPLKMLTILRCQLH